MALNHPILAYGSMLVTASTSLYYAIQGVRTGETAFGRPSRKANRVEDPIYFWFAILCYVVFALALSGVGLAMISGHLD